MNDDRFHADSLSPAPVMLHPGASHQADRRVWQGIPGVERTAAGRLFATWYSGGTDEGPDNYVLLARSDDDGLSWSAPLLAVDPPGKVRAYDPVLWLDPLRRLWLLWAQAFGKWNGRGGVWFIRCDRPDAGELVWTAPRRVANGVMMNKPLVRANGEWLFPVSGWHAIEPRIPEMEPERFSSVFVTTDAGGNFAWRGGADVPLRTFDEHMAVERRDGSLWMLVRTRYGIGQSVSTDGGATWNPGWPTSIASPDTRFHLRRLPGGALLLVGHHGFTGRSHLTAMLSDDDGLSWTARLLLDERTGVSYPDATVADDGRIYVIHDRDRHTAREILLACITEADIRAGRLVSPRSYLRRLVDKAVPAAG